MQIVPLSDVEVAAWRAGFPILDRCAYLVNNSLGAMPAGVPAALAEFTDAWASEGVQAWGTRWLPEVRAVADLLGSLMGAPPGSVVVHQNVATLAAMVWAAVPRDGHRDRVVLTADEWPSHRYLAEAHRRSGLEPVVVPDVDALLAAVDERTALVVCSHVRFRDAAVLDVAAVCRRAREMGAVALVDGYHAVGHMPVDVTAIGADAYVGGSVKWLCGGPGVGWLHVREGSVLRPTDVGWLGHARPFDFAPDWEAADGAMGWLGGTPGIPSLYAAREGYRAVAEVGPARIRATSEVLTAHLVDGALRRGIAVRTPLEPAARAGTVTLDLGAGTAAAASRLIGGGIIVDHRPGAGIRVGPHFFNTVEECERLLDALGPMRR